MKKLDFQVNPEEHSEGRFVPQAEIAGLDVTDQMRVVVEEAFMWISRLPLPLLEQKPQGFATTI